MGRDVTSRYVVLDLEANADRSDPAEHEIIEIGALAIEDGVETGTFETFVRPTRKIHSGTLELTGLNEPDLDTAPPLQEALAGFYDFAGTCPLIAHNGFGYDFRLLDAAVDRTGLNPSDALRLDSMELAHLVFTRARRIITTDVDGGRQPPGRSLDDLSRHYRCLDGPRGHHRALGDARLLQQVLAAMLEALNAPSAARRLQRWILSKTDHPWANFLHEQAEPIPLESVVPELHPTASIGPRGALNGEGGDFDPEQVALMFDVGGSVMGRGRQPRAQQIDMARAVADTLRKGGKHLIEAPTGTGKTLAYLVAAIEYARSVGRPVAVAPHSRVLQDQVSGTLEELQADLGNFTAVQLKGASNYVSLDLLAGEIDDLASAPVGAPTPQASDGLALAILCGWVAQTPTGDWGDLRTGPLGEPALVLAYLQQVLSVGDSLGPAQSEFDRRCFYRRALHSMPHTDVVVMNHALLVTWEGWLRHVAGLVLDEAHNLEEAATGALTEEVSQGDVLALGRAISSTARRLSNATGWSLREAPLNDLLRAQERLADNCTEFGTVFSEYVRRRTGAQRDSRYATTYRLRRGVDTRNPDYEETRRASSQLRAALNDICDMLNEITLPTELKGRYRRSRLEKHIHRLGLRAREQGNSIDNVIWAEDPESWIAIGEIDYLDEQWEWTIRRAPLSVADDLKRLWTRVPAAVLTSATLRVHNSYRHIIESAGLEVAETTTLDSPFTLVNENHVLLLTDYLPAPRARLMTEFTTKSATEIARLLLLTHGRGMALMTARSRLQFVRDHARPILESSGIPLLAQGDAALPELVERIREEQATSLLALRSFWEGVDIPGESLSLLIIEKIPFDSPADPIVGARMEAMEWQGRDPFADYVIPRAALRFAQGVGRLIRTAADRGVTVVLDNRLCRAVPYRDQILSNLPGPPHIETVRRSADAYRRIADHIDDVSYDSEVREKLESVPSPGGWDSLAKLELRADDVADIALVRDRLERIRESFGFREWRSGQRESMERFLRGLDTMAVLPTGSGKSMTFQVPALLLPGVTLVISPLTALMNDQVENLRARAITTVAAIHSGIPQGEWRDILRSAKNGDYKLLYVSPERLWSQEFVGSLAEIEVARVVVDEAHCISQWGHSFRPEYVTIPQALEHIRAQDAPIMAVTATATPEVREEIRRLLRLKLSDVEVIAQSPDRKEIRYYVEQCADRDDRDVRVVQIVEAFRHQAAVVYVPRRTDTSRLATLLAAAGHSARPYHGGMEQSARRHIEDAFRHGEIDVVVATKAFGMGIDKPDIALIVHLEMPTTIEEYVQETGRAARGAADGTGPAIGTAVLMKTPGDCSIHRIFIRSAAPSVETVKSVWNALQPGIHPYDPDQLATGDEDSDSESVDVALAVHYLQEAGGLQRHSNTPLRGRVSLLDDTRARVGELSGTDPGVAARARGIIDLVEDSDTDEYRAASWQARLGRPAIEIARDLLELNRQDILGFSVWRYAWVLDRRPDYEPDWDAIEDRANRRRRVVQTQSEQAKKFSAMERLADSPATQPNSAGDHLPRERRLSGGCRRRAMLEHLGWDDHLRWEDPQRCGRCDGCTLLPRPWSNIRVSLDDLIESLPTRLIVLQLIYDTSRGRARFSRHNLVRTLLGDTGSTHALPEQLSGHPTLGRLRLLGRKGIDSIIDDMIKDGLVTAAITEFTRGQEYESLELTEHGQSLL